MRIGYHRGEEWLNWSIYERPASRPSGVSKTSARNAARLAHGEPKRIRKLETAQQEKASRDLDLHRIEPGDGR